MNIMERKCKINNFILCEHNRKAKYKLILILYGDGGTSFTNNTLHNLFILQGFMCIFLDLLPLYNIYMYFCQKVAIHVHF